MHHASIVEEMFADSDRCLALDLLHLSRLRLRVFHLRAIHLLLHPVALDLQATEAMDCDPSLVFRIQLAAHR